MKVKATKMGFYGKGAGLKRRKAGEIFNLIRESDFSLKWMVWIEKPTESKSEVVEVKAESEPEVESEPEAVIPKPRGNPAWRKK